LNLTTPFFRDENSHELHSFYVELHDDSRNYKNKMKDANLQRLRKGKGPWESRMVEMNNFQNPQVGYTFIFYLFYFILFFLLIMVI